MSFLKVGGRYIDGNSDEYAKPLAVSEDGSVHVSRINEVDVVTLFDAVSKRDTQTMPFTGDNAVDLSDWTSCCIILSNRLDVDASITLYSQTDKTSSQYLRNASGITISIPLPHTANGEIIITPDDYPILNQLRYFKGGVYFSTAPSSGTLSLSLMRKR